VSFLELKSDKKARSIEVRPVKLSDVFSKRRALYLGTDEFRVGCLYQALTLLHKFHDLYKHLPCATEIFAPVLYFAKKVSMKNYPEKVQCLHLSLCEALDASPSCRSCLTMERQLPPALKLFEPKFAEVFDDRKKHAGSREQREQASLVHKHKKEMKGAMREIRRDSQFLATVKLKESLDKDADRKRKVKELFADLASQEGDFKALKRKKDKM